MTKATVSRIRNNFEHGKYWIMKSKPLYKCSARIYETENYIFLESYSTIVAVYDKRAKKIYEYGRYSMTTYQHCRKFNSWLREHGYGDDSYYIHTENYELENWFY